MTIKFYLDKPAAATETAIYLFLRFGKNTLKFNTGKKIYPKYWNQENSENHFRKFTGSPELNHWLSELRNNINKTYYSKQDWTTEDLKIDVFNLVNRNVPKNTQQTFKDALKEFISSRESNNSLANSTIKKYKTLSTHLENFSLKSKLPLRFEIINKKFFDDFSAYLRNDLKHTTNTINKYIKTFKTFVNWAVDNNFTKADTVNIKYKTTDDATEVIYLTYEELMALYDLGLSKGSTLANVRDVFCFACFTGQRFSDIANVKHDDINNGTWTLHQLKVKDTIKNEIPLTEQALTILDRHKNDPKPLPVISNQKTNKHLKTLGQKANINEPIKIVRYRGNEQIVIKEPKYNLLGTHTARRTFITLSLEMKMRPETVMAISGHKDFKTMKRYIAVTQKMKANEMKLTWSNADKIIAIKQA